MAEGCEKRSTEHVRLEHVRFEHARSRPALKTQTLDDKEGALRPCLSRKWHYFYFCSVRVLRLISLSLSLSHCQVSINGHKVGEFESQRGSVSTSLGIHEANVHTVTLESLGLEKHEWVSLLEVSPSL